MACVLGGRHSSTTVRQASVFSFGGAIALGITSVCCPPVAIAAAGAAVAAATVGTGNTIAAVYVSISAPSICMFRGLQWLHRTYNSETNRLRALQNQLSSQLSDLEAEISSLSDQLPELEKQSSHYIVIASLPVKTLESECKDLRCGAVQLQSRLRQDCDLLLQVRQRAEEITSNLHSSEYTKTRRQITRHLVEILQDLGQVNPTGVGNAKALLKRAIDSVHQIELHTPKILAILEKVT